MGKGTPLLVSTLLFAACAPKPADAPGLLIYAAHRGEDTPRVYAVAPDGVAPRALTPEGASAYPYVGPKGPLYILDDDVALPGRRLAPHPGLDRKPSVSPDHAWVLFESDRASFRDLYKVRVADGHLVRITESEAGSFDGAWSRDGKHVAFASSRAGQLDLYVMDQDGENVRRLTDFPGDAVRPAWSSAGRIYFISGRDGYDALFSTTAGGAPRRITDQALGTVDGFSVHPSKERVVLSARDARGHSVIYSVDSYGAIERLSPEGARDADPTWSPDGRFLAFSTVVDGTTQIILARADGSARTRLTHDPEGAWLPRWLPASGLSESGLLAEASSPRSTNL